MESDRERGRLEFDVANPLAGLNASDVDEMILRGRCQELAVVTEGNCSHRPIESGEHSKARQLIDVPYRCQSVGGANGEIFSSVVEVDADAGRGMSFQHVLDLEIRVAEYMNAALPAGQIHLVARLVPHDFIDLEIELFLHSDLVGSRVDECDEILLVADSDRVAVARPCDVDIFAFGVDCVDLFASRSRIPNSDCFVPGGCCDEIGICTVPRELIDGPAVPVECTVFRQSFTIEGEDNDLKNY